MLFLFDVLSLSLFLFYVKFESSFRCINAIINAGRSSSSFSLQSMSSLGCKGLWFVVSFLVPSSGHWSYSLVRFKYSPKYLTKRTSPSVFPLMRFLLYSLVSSCFLILLRLSFLMFSFFRLFEVVCFQYSQILVTCKFPFFRVFWLCLDLVVFWFSLLSYFPCLIPSLSCLYILTADIRV